LWPVFTGKLFVLHAGREDSGNAAVLELAGEPVTAISEQQARECSFWFRDAIWWVASRPELIKSEMSVSTTNSPTSFSQGLTERHYSTDELSALWNLSADTVRRLFEREPGVLVIERARSRTARHYRTLRIPESVAARVHRRLSNPAATRTI
jgi:hypothetical protein